MKRRIISLLLALILLLALFTGCGARSKYTEDGSGSTSYAGEPAKGEAKAAESVEYDRPSAPEAAAREDTQKAEDATAITGSGSVGQTVTNAILAQRKIIRNANVTVEVDDFDVAYGKINSFILGIGFIQESNISTNKVYVDSEQRLVKRGVIVVRVDKDKFEKVLNDVKGLGTVMNENMGTEDVTSKYFDVESRLRLLRYEESRLEEYLKRLDDPDSIFKTQSRLTDIRHEIEGLTVTLRRLDDLVELSTITINMNEKYPGSEIEPKPNTYGDRLLGNFLNSIKGAVRFCGELLIILVQALPVLILLGLFVLVVLFIYRKIAKSSGKNVVKKDKDSGSGM